MGLDQDRRISPANSFTPVNLSDTVEVKLIDLSAEFTNDDGPKIRSEQDLRYCRGFHSNVDGGLSFVAPGSSIVNYIEVKPGGSYPYSIKNFRLTGSTRISDGNLVAWR